MYKSLEHLIREIKEGKCECEKKKDSLEHAIRKVVRKESSYAARDSKPVDEDVGGLAGSGTGGEQKLHAESGKKKKVESEVEDTKLPRDYNESAEQIDEIGYIGTDKFQGRQFQTRPPIIAPPVTGSGERGHGQAAKNVTVQRFRKLDKNSLTMQGKVTEDIISEGPLLGPMVHIPPKMPSKPFAPPPEKLEIFPPLKKAPTEQPPAPAKPKVEVPSKPKEETPVEEPPVKAPAKPKVETPVEAPPKTKTPTEVLAPAKPKVEVPTKTETPVLPKEQPKTQTPEAPKEQPKAPPVPPASGPKMPLPPTTPGGKIKFPGIPYATAKPVELTGPHAPVYTSVSKHRGHRAVKNVYKEEVERKSIQDMPRKNAGDRHDIEFVGRKDADPKSTAEKTSRQAQYKIKVIDEAKKLADVVKRVRKESGEGKTKVFDNVVINPDLNRPDNKNDADLKP